MFNRHTVPKDEAPEELQKKALEIIEKAEAPTRQLTGPAGLALNGLLLLVALYVMYGALKPVITHVYRALFLGVVLVAIFLLYPPRRGQGRDRIGVSDVVLAVLALVAIGYIFIDFEELIYRSAVPTQMDVVMGALLIALLLEATRRTSGMAIPLLIILSILYTRFGAFLPSPWTHRGYDFGRIIGHMYISLEGIFGIPLGVAASFVVLFTIYGALLEYSGAGKFFIDLSFALMGRKPTTPGRTVALASLLLGGPQGSGVATTVTLGSVSWPLLRSAGYDKESAGGLMAAGGIGAVLSPPVFGAAVFLIMEFLHISLWDILLMTIMPTLLFYWALFVMIEFDARKRRLKEVPLEVKPVGKLLLRQGYHFVSLAALVFLIAIGRSPELAAMYTIVATVLMSFMGPKEYRLGLLRLARALAAGVREVLPIAATLAGAGIIVGAFTLTGLGLKMAAIIIGFSGGSLIVALILTAIACMVVGLALPITASYIVTVVIVSPALIHLGVPDYAVHMLVFYYSILSEVSPPVGLSPFAASAITGGNPFLTMIQSWKYTLAAFLVPFMFASHPQGLALLLRGTPIEIVVMSVVTFIGLYALAGAIQGWALGPANWVERALLLVSGITATYPLIPEPWNPVLVIGLLAAAISLQKLRHSRLVQRTTAEVNLGGEISAMGDSGGEDAR